MENSVNTQGKLKIDWVRSFSDLPSKAAITDETGKIVKEISYDMGIRIEKTLKTSLDELEVEESENKFYIKCNATGRMLILIYTGEEQILKTK